MANKHNKKPQFSKPIQIRYYAGGRLGLDNWSTIGSCLTPMNAKRAAVVRLITEQWAKAIIIDRYTGDVLCKLTHNQGGIAVVE